jgi:uncharacterized protein (TIRG00374 family)
MDAADPTDDRPPGDAPPSQKKKGWKHWALFAVRWGIAVVGVWVVVSHMSVRDQAWVILDHQTNRPVQVSLRRAVGDAAPVFPAYDPTTDQPIDVPRADVVNEPDAKTVALSLPAGARKVELLGLDLVGDINKVRPMVARLLVADDPTTPAYWVSAARVAGGFSPKTPYPRDQVGLESMVRGARPGLLWLALLVFPATFVITSYRWHALLAALDIVIPMGRVFTLNMVGGFYNTFMPGSTGGDALKAWYASKHTPWRTRAVMSVLVDRVIGLLALIVVGGAAAATQWEVSACRKVALAAAAVLAMTAAGLAVFYNPTLHRLSGLDFILKRLPMQKQVKSAIDTMHLYGRRPGLAAWSLVISLPVHAAVVSSAMFAGMAFGLPLHWAYYWVAVPVIVLAGAIPISPQGAGVMEGFAVLLTRNQGVTVSQAFALTMSIRMVQIIWNLSGGAFVLRGGFHAPDDQERDEVDPGHMLPRGPGGEPAVAV